jgi:hypothetical protein
MPNWIVYPPHPDVFSAVRSVVYRVLHQSAEGGKHGPHDMAKTFLRTADILAEEGIIEKRLDGVPYTSLQVGYVSENYPLYGVHP